MPASKRPSGKAQKIAELLLGKKVKTEDQSKKKKRRKNRLDYEETRRTK